VAGGVPAQLRAGVPADTEQPQYGLAGQPSTQCVVEIVGGGLEPQQFVLRYGAGVGLPLADDVGVNAVQRGVGLVAQAGGGNRAEHPDSARHGINWVPAVGEGVGDEGLPPPPAGGPPGGGVVGGDVLGEGVEIAA
jgi:hypothetical protein